MKKKKKIDSYERADLVATIKNIANGREYMNYHSFIQCVCDAFRCCKYIKKNKLFKVLWDQ